jgi:magnesium chelatase family protein
MGAYGGRGALSMAEGARREGLGALILPEQNAPEAPSIGGPGIYGMRSLKEAVGFLAGQEYVSPTTPVMDGRGAPEEPIDGFTDVAGNGMPKEL